MFVTGAYEMLEGSSALQVIQEITCERSFHLPLSW